MKANRGAWAGRGFVLVVIAGLGLALVACGDDASDPPETCASLAVECGTWDDGQGGQLECGTCGDGQVCDSAGTCQVA